MAGADDFPVPLPMRVGWLPDLGMRWLDRLRAEHEQLVRRVATTRRAAAAAVDRFDRDAAAYREALVVAARDGEPLDEVPRPVPAEHKAAQLRVLMEAAGAAVVALGDFVERALTRDLRDRLPELQDAAAHVYSRIQEDRQLGDRALQLLNVVTFPHNEIAAVRRVVTGEQVRPEMVVAAAGADRVVA